MGDEQSNLRIIIQTIKQGSGDKEAETGLGNLKSGLGDLSQGLLGVNLETLTFAGSLVLLGKGLKDCIDDAAQNQTIMTRLGVTLTDMDRNITAAGLERTAMQLQNISEFNPTTSSRPTTRSRNLRTLIPATWTTWSRTP